MKTPLFFTLTSAVAFALACTGGSTTTEAPPAPEAPAAATTGDIGVASCDKYIKDMTACLSTMDASMKGTYETSMKQLVDSWRAAATTEAGKSALDAGCTAALSGIPTNCSATGAAAAPATGAAPAVGTAPAAGGPAGTVGTTTVTAGGTTTTVTTGATGTTVTTGAAAPGAAVKVETKTEDHEHDANPKKQGRSLGEKKNR